MVHLCICFNLIVLKQIQTQEGKEKSKQEASCFSPMALRTGCIVRANCFSGQQSAGLLWKGESSLCFCLQPLRGALRARLLEEEPEPMESYDVGAQR